MHFQSSLIVLSLASLLVSSLVTAGRLPTSQFSPRSTTLAVEVDICAYIDVSIDLGVNIVDEILGLTADITIDIKECLCLEALVKFCSGQASSRGLSTAQETTLLASLTSLLTGSGGPGKTCTYPSTPCTQTCSASNVCGYSCPFGYMPSTNSLGRPTCVCQSSDEWSCNGTCISKQTPCPSQPASNNPHHKRRIPRPAKAWCPRGTSVCGIYAGGAESWECVDTATDLESCGGCAIPHRSTSIPGQDCTQLPHISDVACVRGACQISRCRRGFVVAKNGTQCVAESSRYHSSLLVGSSANVKGVEVVA